MTTFEQNSKILKSRYPQLSELGAQSSSKTTGVQAVRPSVHEDFRSRSKHATLIFIKGLESAATLKALVDHFNNPNAEFVLIEPTLTRLSDLLSQEGVKPWLSHPRIHWWVNRTSDEFFADAYDFLRVPARLFHMRAALFIEGAKLDQNDREYFVKIEDEWLACQKQRIRSLGGVEDSRVGFENVIRNKTSMEQNPGVNLLKGEFKDLPAIVISTGPSLKSSLDDLKELQNRAVLIAADASLKILLDAGITPHFVCSIERDEGPAAFFKNLGKVSSNLVAYPMVPEIVLQSYGGPRWVAYRDYGYFYYLENEMPRGIISSSSSVAHMCLRLAAYLDCTEIALVGQDLAYDPDTLQSHSEGVAVGEWAQPRSLEEIRVRAAQENLGNVFLVEGNLATEVPTNSVYFSFMKEFSWEASQLKKTVTNCTQGGARIPNMKWSSLNAWAMGAPKPVDIMGRIQSKREAFKPGSLKFKEIRSFLAEFSSKWKNVVALVDALESQDLQESVRHDTYRSLRKSEAALLDDVRYITMIIQNAGREYLELVNDLEVLDIENKTSTAEYHSKVKELYHLIDKVTSQLLACF